MIYTAEGYLKRGIMLFIFGGNFMIKPFHQWKKEIVEADSKKHGVLIHYRWPKHEFYTRYGYYIQKMKAQG